MSRAADGNRPAGGVYLGRLLGVPFYLSPSWFVFAGAVTLLYQPLVTDEVHGLGGFSYLVAFSFAVLLAVSVLAHELGHCAVSRGLGLPVRRVTLALLVGSSEIEREPQTPGREYLVAVAGPLVSLLLAAIGVAVLPQLEDGTVGYLLLSELALANGIVAIFNLLPGLPLDGGRVLRAAVWRVSGDKLVATRFAAYAGRGLALLVLVGVGLTPLQAILRGGAGPGTILGLVFALVIASFLWTGASATLLHAQFTSRLTGVTAGGLARRLVTVPANLPLAQAVARAEEAGARAIVVADVSGTALGIVSEAAVAATPEQRRPWVEVSTLARPLVDALRLPSHLGGRALIDALQETPASEYLVVDAADRAIGVLVTADVAAVVDPRTARQTAAARG